MEKYSIRDILETFQKLSLNIDKKLYKTSKYDALKLTEPEKKTFFEEKFSKMIAKPKVLWKSTLNVLKKFYSYLIYEIIVIISNNAVVFFVLFCFAL